MNTTIYKYTTKVTDTQIIELPKGSEILSVIEQYENIVFYALIDPEETSKEYFKFQIRGTGHNAGNFKRQNYIFLGTVPLIEGQLIFHVFYRKLTPEETPKEIQIWGCHK